MDASIDKMEFALESWIKLMLEQGCKMGQEDTKKQVIRFTKALNALKIAILHASKRFGMQTSGKTTVDGDEEVRGARRPGLLLRAGGAQGQPCSGGQALRRRAVRYCTTSMGVISMAVWSVRPPLVRQVLSYSVVSLMR